VRSDVTKIGVLALQGDVARHVGSLEALGVDTVRVTEPRDLEDLAALVLPGGESTTMITLIEAGGLREPLAKFLRERPALGTCAGVILLGTGGAGLPGPTFGVLDVEVERNAYGRQIDSFSAELRAPVVGGSFTGVFIRAPRLRAMGRGVEVVATLERQGQPAEPVAVRAGHTAGLCFHPELTSDLRFHRWFLEDVAGLRLPSEASTVPAGERAGER
jgi:pyridoxal 5'-phosphate synthase pdxT subunit